MKILFYIFVFLFLLKLIWNLSIPTILETRHHRWKRHGGAEPAGVSMALGLDIALLLLLGIAAFFNGDLRWPSYVIFGAGVICIAFSYFGGGILGAVVRKLLNR
jgi:hypothetical protein